MNLLERNINQKVRWALDHYLKSITSNANTSIQWLLFYRFIAEAFLVKQNERPSVSQLTRILKEKGIKDAAKLSVIYAHTLYTLAVFNHVDVYGKGFNP